MPAVCSKYKNIIFDFDGVLADTNPIRINGFRELFKEFPKEQVDALVAFSAVNGGLSRYEKIKYFFQSIRREEIRPQDVDRCAQRYSDIVKNDIITAAEIGGSVEFLSSFAKQYVYAIVSGSDQEELRDVCRQRGIGPFFKEILGSPIGKEENLKSLVQKNGWGRDTCVFIGDSVNDYQAARSTGVAFIGRNSGMVDWSEYPGVAFFDTFKKLPECLTSNP